MVVGLGSFLLLVVWEVPFLDYVEEGGEGGSNLTVHWFLQQLVPVMGPSGRQNRALPTCLSSHSRISSSVMSSCAVCHVAERSEELMTLIKYRCSSAPIIKGHVAVRPCLYAEGETHPRPHPHC